MIHRSGKSSRRPGSSAPSRSSTGEASRPPRRSARPGSPPCASSARLGPPVGRAGPASHTASTRPKIVAALRVIFQQSETQINVFNTGGKAASSNFKPLVLGEAWPYFCLSFDLSSVCFPLVMLIILYKVLFVILVFGSANSNLRFEFAESKPRR